jgi:predicted nucleic acid-binding protein
MNLVDSSGWLEYFADGPNASYFAAPLEDTGHLIVPSICLLEVFKKILKEKGEAAALEKVAHMEEGTVIDLDSTLALAAAKLGHSTGLPLADGVVLATARMHHAVLWTQDSDFAAIEGVKYQPKLKKK